MFKRESHRIPLNHLEFVEDTFVTAIVRDRSLKGISCWIAGLIKIGMTFIHLGKTYIVKWVKPQNNVNIFGAQLI